MLPAPARRWFHFHLSTALAVSLVASVLLGVNLSQRAELQPIPLSIGRGDASVPVKAFFSQTYRGWPKTWDLEDKDLVARVGINAAFAAGVLLLTLVLCETLIRRRERTSKSYAGVMVWLGVVALLAWLNFVLRPEGPYVVLGWPLQYQVFIRAEAVVSRETVERWEQIQREGFVHALINAVVAASVLIGIPVLARGYARRAGLKS